jgi:hypothetical protein
VVVGETNFRPGQKRLASKRAMQGLTKPISVYRPYSASSVKAQVEYC